MPLFQINLPKSTMTAIMPRTFAEVNVSERGHLQKLLRENPSALEQAIDEKLFIISEEDSNWIDSDRRVDLLALDKGSRTEDSQAITVNLVVIELKVVEGGGHMELQSIRYAAMLSNMNFDGVVKRYENFSKKPFDVAQSELLKFLEDSESGLVPVSEQVLISKNPRIILISPSFTKEITTTVL
jgi:RecB family endonuclease NucS